MRTHVDVLLRAAVDEWELAHLGVPHIPGERTTALRAIADEGAGLIAETAGDLPEFQKQLVHPQRRVEQPGLDVLGVDQFTQCGGEILERGDQVLAVGAAAAVWSPRPALPHRRQIGHARPAMP